MARHRVLSSEDVRLWAAYGQTMSRLMPGKVRLPVEPEPAPPVSSVPPAPEAVKPVLRRSAPGVSIGLPPGGVDKSTWKKFSTGKIRTGAKLDLHGHTAARAHHAVTHFIEQAYAGHIRCVEIVTGKGEILARELPHWLNAPGLRPLILGITHPHAANTGSVRVLLRRHRA